MTRQLENSLSGFDSASRDKIRFAAHHKDNRIRELLTDFLQEHLKEHLSISIACVKGHPVEYRLDLSRATAVNRIVSVPLIRIPGLTPANMSRILAGITSITIPTGENENVTISSVSGNLVGKASGKFTTLKVRVSYQPVEWHAPHEMHQVVINN